MKYLPFDNVVLNTRLSKAELVNELSKNVGTPHKYFKYLSNHSKPFSGTITTSGFRIWRVINYRNSFLPEIIGEFNETAFGCSINIRFRLNRFVFVFMCIWMGFVSIACLGILFYILNNGNLSAFQFIPFGMFLFGALLTVLPFKHEVNKAKEFLVKITKGEIEA